MTTHNTLEQSVGQTIFDATGHKVGTAANLYQSEYSNQPEWVTIRTGMFGTKESFAPLSGAFLDEEGLHIRADKDVVKQAPRIDDSGYLSETEAGELYRYYGVRAEAAVAGAMPDDGRTATGDDRWMTERDARPAADGSEQPEPMTRSEERLRAGTERVESGRVRLHKYVVTEEQQIRVPVSHEEVRVTREPVEPREPGAHRAEARGEMAGIEADEREFVLHEERPVVQKESVPVERVGLDVETVRGEEEIRDQVRKERIEFDDDSAYGDRDGGERR